MISVNSNSLGPHRGAVRRLQDVGHRARARDVRARPVHRDEERLHRHLLRGLRARPGRVRAGRSAARARSSALLGPSLVAVVARRHRRASACRPPARRSIAASPRSRRAQPSALAQLTRPVGSGPSPRVAGATGRPRRSAGAQRLAVGRSTGIRGSWPIDQATSKPRRHDVCSADDGPRVGPARLGPTIGRRTCHRTRSSR